MGKKYFPNSEGDLTSLLRSAVKSLNEQPDIERGGLYHTLKGSMNNRVMAARSIINVPHFILLMQELGLLRRWGGGTTTVWQVICLTFFDEVVTPVWLERAQANLDKHVETMESLRLLRERVTKLEGQGSVAPVGSRSLDEIATMVIELEKLREAVGSRDQEIVSLRRELEEQSKVNPDAALAAAIRRARERTT